MKAICISCFDYYATRMKGLIEYFQEKGFDVQYLITDFNHFSKLTYKVDYGCSKQLHVLPYSKNISLRRLMSHIIFSRKVMREINKEKPDLIYCVIPPNSLVKQLGFYRMKHGYCKLVLDLYDEWPESFPISNPNFVIKTAFRYWASLRDRYIRYADLLISVSKSGKDDIYNKFKMNAKVLMPTVAVGKLPDYSFNVQNCFSFCYLGHVNYITDMDLGTAILGGIARRKSIELHIIGEGQNKDIWVEKLTQIGVKVICHGVVFDDDKKREIFAQCNMGLNIPRPEIKSTMALKSVEYMRYGLPFINSGLGDNEEMVRKYRIGINVKDCDVVDEILSLSSDDLRVMHDNTVRCYNENFVKQDYDEVFSEVINDR